MVIDRETVRRVALLSRLSLTDEEMTGYISQLSCILDYISKLNELNTDNVTPTSHPLGSLKNVYRSDTIKKSLTVEQAIQNAPSKEDDLFKVPQIIEAR